MKNKGTDHIHKKNHPPDMISVVIPVYNGERTLGRTLQAIYASEYANFEVIVVDDGSTDRTVEIAHKYSCRVMKTQKKGSGPANGRNVGADAALGKYILFTDDDVLVQPQTLSQIVSDFENDSSAAAVVGNLVEENSMKNFFSRFKNLHHRYYISIFPKYIHVTFTSITAIRKDIFQKANGFDTTIDTPSVEDVEFGQRLTDLGYKILHDKTLTVVHEKHYSMKSYFKNTLNRSYCYFKLFMINQGKRRLINEKKAVYFPWSAVISFMIGPIIPALLLAGILAFNKASFFLLLPASLLFLFALLNKGFLLYLLKIRGFFFSISSLFVVLADSWIISIGSSFALVDLILNKRKRWTVI